MSGGGVPRCLSSTILPMASGAVGRTLLPLVPGLRVRLWSEPLGGLPSYWPLAVRRFCRLPCCSALFARAVFLLLSLRSPFLLKLACRRATYIMPNGNRYPFRIGPNRHPRHAVGSPSPLHTSDSSETCTNKLRSYLVVVRYSRRWRRRAALRLRSRRRYTALRLVPAALEAPLWDHVLAFL